MTEDELIAWVNARSHSINMRSDTQKFRYFEKNEKGQKVPLDVWAITFTRGSGRVHVESYFFRRDLFASDAFDLFRNRKELKEDSN